MSKGKDYYKVLGLTKDVNPDEIKKAYKKLAIKWHPDKNPGKEKEAEEKFKDIAEAYSVLSDPTKKKQYDRYGTIDPNQNMGDFGFNSGFGGFQGFGFGSRGSGSFEGFSFDRAEELFRDVFGDSFGSFGSHNKSNPKSKGQDRNRVDFSDENDGFPMNQGFGNMFQNFGFGGFGSNLRGGKDPFSEDFFGNFGGMNMNFSEMNSMSGGFGGTSKSVSTSTIIKNGKQVTVTKTTVTNPDGTTHTEVQESVGAGGKTLTEKRYVDNGQQQRLHNGAGFIENGGSRRSKM